MMQCKGRQIWCSLIRSVLRVGVGPACKAGGAGQLMIQCMFASVCSIQLKKNIVRKNAEEDSGS